MITETVLEITKAEYCSPYSISLCFSDGHSVVVDFSTFISSSQHPDILKYKKLDLFKQYRIDGGDLQWNDYELCFPLESLYSGVI